MQWRLTALGHNWNEKGGPSSNGPLLCRQVDPLPPSGIGAIQMRPLGCKEEEATRCKDSTAFVGPHLGGRRSSHYALDLEGRLIKEARIPTTKSAFRRPLAFGQAPARAA